MFIAGIEIFFGFVAGAILLTVGVMIAGMLWAIVCATTFTLTRALLQKSSPENIYLKLLWLRGLRRRLFYPHYFGRVWC